MTILCFESFLLSKQNLKMKEVFIMEKLLEILREIQPDADYENCTTLVTDNYLDSLAILSLVAELEEEFDIEIPTVEIVPANFNSAKSMWEMISRLKED